MEAKNDDHEPNRDTKDEPAPPLAPTLKLVAKQFLARRAALGEAALDCDGIECLYGDFVDENADEFEGFGPADGSGNDHGLKALHEEFLALFTRDVEGALASSDLTLEDFVRDVEEARPHGTDATYNRQAQGLQRRGPRPRRAAPVLCGCGRHRGISETARAEAAGTDGVRLSRGRAYSVRAFVGRVVPGRETRRETLSSSVAAVAHYGAGDFMCEAGWIVPRPGPWAPVAHLREVRADATS